MKVGEIMTKNPVCCWPSSSSLSAALLMQESDAESEPRGAHVQTAQRCLHQALGNCGRGDVLRPSDFHFKKFTRETTFCPFCEAHEAFTPPEIFAIRHAGLPANDACRVDEA